MVYTKTYKFAILYRQKKCADFSTKHQIVLKNKLHFCKFFKKKQAKKQRKTAFFEGEKRRFNLIFFQNCNAILLSFRPAQPSMESMHASTFRRLKAVSK